MPDSMSILGDSMAPAQMMISFSARTRMGCSLWVTSMPVASLFANRTYKVWVKLKVIPIQSILNIHMMEQYVGFDIQIYNIKCISALGFLHQEMTDEKP